MLGIKESWFLDAVRCLIPALSNETHPLMLASSFRGVLSEIRAPGGVQYCD